MKARYVDRETSGVHTVKKVLASGKTKLYRYHRESRRRIYAEPNTPAYLAEWARVATRKPELSGKPGVYDRPKATRVYFVRATASGLIKIGKAARPKVRLEQLQTSCPDKLILVATIEDKSGGALETFLHAKFAKERIRGEWFEPSPELLAYVAEMGVPA